MALLFKIIFTIGLSLAIYFYIMYVFDFFSRVNLEDDIEKD